MAEARAAREQAKQMLAQGTDPSAAKQAAKQERAAALANTFKAIAEQWHTQQLPRWKPSHAARVWHSLELDVFPYIGNRPIAEITVRACHHLIQETAAAKQIPPKKATAVLS